MRSEGMLAIAFMALLAAAAPLAADEADQGDEGVVQFLQSDSKVVSDAQPASAAKVKLGESDTPASIQVVTADDIARYGYRNVAEALAGVTGLFVQNTGTYEELGVRGFNLLGDYASRVLVLVDGNATNDPVWGAGSIGNELAVDIKDVKRIEIVMGPGSAIYGNHAMAAVINVITRKGADLNGGSAEAGYASYNTDTGRFSYGERFGALDFYVSGALIDSSGRDYAFGDAAVAGINSGVFQNSDREQAQKTLAKLSWDGFSLAASYAKRDKELPTGAYGSDFDVSGSTNEDGNWMVEGRYQRPLGDDADLMARVYYRDTWYAGDYNLYQSGEGNNHEFSDADWGGGELQFNWQTGQGNHLTLGGEYMNAWRLLMRSWTDQAGTLLDTTDSMVIASGYVQDLYKPLDQVTLVGGLRYDRYSTFGDAWTPRAGVLVALPADTTAKLLWGNAFNAPSASDLFWSDNVTELGNPGLGPEKLSTWELDLENAVARHVSAGVAGYYNNVYDLIEYVALPTAAFPVPENQGQVRTLGLDLSLKADIDNVKARVGWTHQRSTDLVTGLELSNSAEDTGSAALSWPLLANRLFISGEAVYSGTVQTYNGYWLDPWVRTDITVLAKGLLPSVALTLKVRNVFDSVYTVPISEEPALVEAVPQDRRNYEARLSYDF